jgi:signal transduction histidine kinase
MAETALIQPAQDSPPVGELITSRETIPPQTRVAAVADRFFAARELEALAVVEGGLVLALTTRNKLFSILFHRFGMELFGKDPIIEVADRQPLTAHVGDRLDAVLDRAMSRSFQDIYDEIVVVDDAGRFAGILSVKKMVVAQGGVLAQSILQRELALTRAAEMEKLSEIKSQFLAHVTHELRSPVNAIIGLAALMDLAMQHGRPEQLPQKLALLSSSAVNLRAIITNILDLSKIEAGRMEVIVEPFDLVPLLHEVAATTRVLLGGKPVEVLVEIEGGKESLAVLTDAVKLRQILVNLTSNAAKFTEEGRIVLALRRLSGGIELEVRDTGIGIRAQDLEKLFGAFNQLEDAKTRRYEGTGLGLAITRQLVGLLGGRISVDSTYGRGATFTVVLPVTSLQHGSDKP